jgi:hypothetical protein
MNLDRNRYSVKVNCLVCSESFPTLAASDGHEHFSDEFDYEAYREAAANGPEGVVADLDAQVSRFLAENEGRTFAEAVDAAHESALRMNQPTCPVTLIRGCKARHCELHYMDAELKLKPEPEPVAVPLDFVPPGVCSLCLGEADHLPYDLGCADAFGPRW